MSHLGSSISVWGPPTTVRDLTPAGMDPTRCPSRWQTAGMPPTAAPHLPRSTIWHGSVRRVG